MALKLADIPEEQYKRAAECCVQAWFWLRDEAPESARFEGVGDDGYQWHIDNFIFNGRSWPRIARIHTREDAVRELTDLARQHPYRHDVMY